MTSAKTAAPLAVIADTDLTARLATWTETQGITAADSREALAERVIASLGGQRVGAWLDEDGTDYLRATAVRYASPEPLSDGQWVTEDHRHGHGPKPRKQTRRGNG